MSAKIPHLRQFILIDPSLKDLGGHHYPYALSVLQAAASAGLQPVLATHAGFHQADAIDAKWPLHAVFRHPGYSRYTLDTQSPAVAGSATGAAAWLRARWARHKRRLLAQAFAADCGRLFATVKLAAGDVVFLATASELDLCGLALLLREAGLPEDIDWHLQFHFGIFRARPPQYPQFTAVEQAMRASFLQSMAMTGAARLHFYCTTEPLTLQYRRLDVAPFATLPYPVHALFAAPHARPAEPEPVRIACLGHNRREKGQGQLPALLQELWVEYFKPGRAQLVLQMQRPALRRQLVSAVERLGGDSTVALEFAPTGLGLVAYATLLRGCDIGLLLYDSARYYDRCSGVLLELLTAGVPVVVPGGCWLGEQLAPSQQRYLQGLHLRLRQEQRLRQLPIAITAFGLGATASTEFSVNIGAVGNTLLLQWRWQEPDSVGTYLRIELLPRGAATAGATPTAQVVGRDPADAEARCILRTQPGTKATLRFSNAYQGSHIAISDCAVYEITGDPVPLGAAGLALGDLSMAGAAISDIIDHIAHYKRHAAQLALDITGHYHAPGVVAQLLAASARATGPGKTS